MKPIVNKISLFVTTLFLSTFAFAGGRDGGGGTSVYCKKAGEQFPISGYYFFDYAVSKNSTTDWTVPNNNPEEYLSKVTEKLIIELPLLFSDKEALLNYAKNVKSNWEVLPPQYNLKNTDEPDKKLLPKNCLPNKIKQVVTYSNNKYYYRIDALEELAATGPEQTSALYIHELFRQAYGYESGKTTVIAKWNQLFHSAKWLNNTLGSNSQLYREHDLLTFEAINTNISLVHLRQLKHQYVQTKDDNKRATIEDEMRSAINQIESFFQVNYKIYSKNFIAIGETAKVIEDQQKCSYVKNNLDLQNSVLNFVELSKIALIATREIYYDRKLKFSKLCTNVAYSIFSITYSLPNFYPDEDLYSPQTKRSCEFNAVKRIKKLNEDISILCSHIDIWEN